MSEIIESREKLAELCHKQWSGWIKYMFGKCLKKTNGTILIPEWAVTRWRRQAYTPYNKLSSQEKDSDRTEADKFIVLLKQQPTAGEFTKKYREKLKKQYPMCHKNCSEWDLLDRLDRAEAINKDLLEACDKVRDWLDTSSLQQILVHYTEDKRRHVLIMGIASNLERLEAAIAKAKQGGKK